jgi:dTDP-4-dehydrorhamnose reductase
VQPSEVGLNRALVLGASGFVGRALLAALGPEAVGTHHARPWPGSIPFDATRDDLPALLDRAGGGIGRLYLLHGAVNPEACAADPAGTAAINVAGVQRLVADAVARGILPIFVSSDYVHDGTRGGRTEAEPLTPNTEYGRQKAAVEQWMAGLGAPWLVARLSKVVGEAEGVHSVLGQLLPEIRRGATLRMATDQVFSPAHVEDTARALAELPGLGARGVVNVAGPVAWSRYDLTACLLAAIRRRDPAITASLVPCSLREIPFREQRPLNTSLDTTKLQSLLPWRFRPMEEVCERIAETAFGPARAEA